MDALRGIAALMVVFHHMLYSGLPAPDWLHDVNLGRAGVQLFFVVSGYVSCALLLESRARWSDATGFMAWRMVRLAPPYFVVVIAVLLLVLYERLHPSRSSMPLRSSRACCWALVCTAIAVWVAALAHRLVERPTIRWSHKFGRSASVPPPAAPDILAVPAAAELSAAS